MKINNI